MQSLSEPRKSQRRAFRLETQKILTQRFCLSTLISSLTNNQSIIPITH